MLLARLLIENFRQIERTEIDFTDSLGRVREVTLLVGPNGSGKTTILDAIAAAIGPGTELPATRERLQLSPARIVRKGATFAKVTCWLRFSDDEIAATREVFRFAADDAEALGSLGSAREEDEKGRVLPDEAREVQLTWIYPDPRNQSALGRTEYEPELGWMPLKARVHVARLLRTGRVNAGWFKRAGQVVTFDQQRTSLSKTIRRDIWEIIHGPGAEEGDRDKSRRTSDARTILLDLMIRSQFPSKTGPKEDDFERVASRYAEICAPRSISGVVQNELGVLDVQLSDGKYEYGFEGVSSGEEMVLLFLIKLVSDRIHRSIVLVDEVELHQHPVWQLRLLDLLPRIGENNQIIATTHSSYLRDVVPLAAVHDLSSRSAMVALGDLGDSNRGGEPAANG